MKGPAVQLFCAAILLIVFGCSPKEERQLFLIRKGPDIGIDFRNEIVADDSLNAMTFEYIYNGSGVGVGDFNQDGLPDLFFGGNQVSSKLYLNKGNLRFADITMPSGTSTSRWVTGVSVVDINADGWPDIYLSVAGKTEAENRRNLLFVNKGLKDEIPVFEEMAAQYGLDDERYGTIAAFLDYDKDGDLDAYLVNNWLERFNRNNLRPKRIRGEAESTDRLYRNNGDLTFTDVSDEAGITIEGYGLGVAVCDINQDSWPDIYVSNDFLSNDLLWINEGDGTFKNRIGEFLKHQTHNGMGVDVADFNNDAAQDIVVVDMLPPGHKRQKLMTPGQNYDLFHMSLDQGYEPQYMRNTLQLNRGQLPDGRVLFSEIAFMSDVAQTDWSWAPLFADFDNDGWKDLFIANGYRKDVTHLDFIFFGAGESPFGTPEVRKERFDQELEQLDEVKLSNYMFRNTGSLTFEDKTQEWGVELPTFSNGAAYADFDNDGDLDLVTNNIDQEVIFYENRVDAIDGDNHHYIRLQPENAAVGGEKIFVYAGGETQFIQMSPYRGFQSTVENAAHFGLGTSIRVDSVIIQWPGGNGIIWKDIPADTVLRYDLSDTVRYRFYVTPSPPAMFKPIQPADYKHREMSPSDIMTTRTLLHELTRFGPCLAVGDVNGDNLDDFFVGGEKGIAGKLYIQHRSGIFSEVPFPSNVTGEDGAARFFDFDNDNDLDLYIASCASFSQEPAIPHRIYKNDGTGIFTPVMNMLPEITSSASCVESADYDGDGDLDLFLGGRLKEGAYPLAPRSYLLRNDNGVFTDITDKAAPILLEPGMITAAVWADLDQNGTQDLVLAGEWETIRVFMNQGNVLVEKTEAFGLSGLNGWWNCLRVADVNSDGYPDILAGNTGKNSYFKPTKEQPVEMIAKDFDQNGSVDPVVTYYNPVEEERFIVHNRLVLIDQIPGIKKRFATFTDYATTPFSKAFTDTDKEGAAVLKAYKLESVMLVNQAGKSFTVTDLPEFAQLSTINDFLVRDLNGDDAPDVIAVGNSYAQETLFGRYDASVGVILINDGSGGWTALNPVGYGFSADKNARSIHQLQTPFGPLVVVANNNDSLQFFRLDEKIMLLSHDVE